MCIILCVDRQWMICNYEHRMHTHYIYYLVHYYSLGHVLVCIHCYSKDQLVTKPAAGYYPIAPPNHLSKNKLN